MKTKLLLLRFAVLMAAMMCALGAAAAEAYANYTPSNTTLTFYYDNLRSSRTGTTYDLNEGSNDVGWDTDGTNANVTRVVFDPSFADARPTTTYDWFFNMQNLESMTGMSYLNTSEVTNMSWMFYNCNKLTSLDLSSFNTSKVENMRSMFVRCTSLKSIDLSRFNTSKVTNMYNLFFYCTDLANIYVGSGWSTDAVTNSEQMFYHCTKLVGGQGTTYSSSNPQDKTYAHIDGGTSNPGYFTAATEAYACYTPSNTTLTFYYDNSRSSRSGTTYDLNTGSNDAGWDTDGTKSDVTRVVFDPSFADARPTSTFDWFYMMNNLESITGLRYLNTSEVTNMGHMFNSCYKLTSLDLSTFNTSRVTAMNCMFHDCRNLQTIYVGTGWSTAAVTYSDNMFYKCSSLVGGKGTTYNYSHVDAAYAHIDGGPSNPGYFTDRNVVPEAYACYTPSNTTLTFYYDNQRSSRTGTTYDLNTGNNDTEWESDGTNVNVTKVVFNSSFASARPTTTYAWFYGMRKLESITGISYLNTSEVTIMTWMFSESTKLTTIDLSGFNTAKVTNMQGMFSCCNKLTTIYAGSGWTTNAATSYSNMFFNCTSLVGGQGTTWNSSNPTDKTYAHIDGGPSNPGYFTAKNAGLRGDVNGDGQVKIDDVTALINLLLSGNISAPAADCNLDGKVAIGDVTALINYLLSSQW